MTEVSNQVLSSIDESFKNESASTRRKFVAGAAGVIGSMGVLALPAAALAEVEDSSVQTILNVAATAEVLATIVNTEGQKKVSLDFVTRRNVRDAARQELDHYNVLVSLGAKPLTKKIWVPNAVLGSRKGLLEALVFGDGVFVNAYQIAVTTFGNAGNGKYARYAAEFMGVESVHRALAKQSLGKPGNDQVFASGSTPYFSNVLHAVDLLEDAGFGFDKKGKHPGKFYYFDQVKHQVPHTPEVHSRSPH